MIYPVPFINYCASLNYRLTSLRKSILFILWRLKKPLKAYDILNELLQIKKNSKPPTVYRVLDYLVSCKIVHKIESIQSYTLCSQAKKKLMSEWLMVCNNCYQVHEAYDNSLQLLIQKLASEQSFNLSLEPIELKGYCRACQQE